MPVRVQLRLITPSFEGELLPNMPTGEFAPTLYERFSLLESRVTKYGLLA